MNSPIASAPFSRSSAGVSGRELSILRLALRLVSTANRCEPIGARANGIYPGFASFYPGCDTGRDPNSAVGVSMLPIAEAGSKVLPDCLPVGLKLAGDQASKCAQT